jgi:NADPH:quinone reductase-like Zn-dependent oxidoreductase
VTRPQTLRPASGQVRIGVATIGVGPLGTHAAGTVDAVGPDSAGFARGDRVTFRATSKLAKRMVVPEHDLVGVPGDVSLDDAVGVVPCAAIARMVVKLSHRVARGDRVRIDESTGVYAPYLAAWVQHVGGTVVTDDGPADAVLTAQDVAVARNVRTGHGLAQQAAADVYAAIRAGVFDGVGPTGRLLHPSDVTLAA